MIYYGVGLVPEGQNEGSLARSAWKMRICGPSRRDGLIGFRHADGYTADKIGGQLKAEVASSRQSYRTSGTVHLSGIPGTSCQATFI